MLLSRTFASRVATRGLLVSKRFMAEMPVPQSSKAKLWQGHPQKEGWESTMAWFYGASAILLVGILGFSPETSIQAWAKQEALVRLNLKESGVVSEFEFGKHYQDHEEEYKNAWDQFSSKAIIQKEVDDDDDDDDDEDDDEDDEE